MRMSREEPPESQLTYVHTSWWMACSKCCVFTMALIFPAELEAQYGVTISTLDSQASTLEGKEINLSNPSFNLSHCLTHLPVFSVFVGPGVNRGPDWLFPPPAVFVPAAPGLLLCLFSRNLLKNESPPEVSCLTGSSDEPAGAIMSGIPGMSSKKSSSDPKLIVLRFFLERCVGGPYLVVISKSPYIRRINALFSSIKFSMRSLGRGGGIPEIN